MGGAGIIEYRSAGGVGPLISFFKCWILGGLDWLLFLACTFPSPDLGFVAKRLFSCSSRASRRAVD